MEIGFLGRKLGMTRIFTEDGRWIVVTLVEAGPCKVVQRKTRETDGYEAIQLGFGDVKESRCTKPVLGHFKKAGANPTQTLREFRVDEDNELKRGDEIRVDMFELGDLLDISGISKGKGFAGVQKRHGFGGGPATHGSHLHRGPGSIGMCADPSKVHKGTKLPGHMGNKRVTARTLEVVRVDAEKNLLAVRGPVPGANGGIIEMKRSVKTVAH